MLMTLCPKNSRNESGTTTPQSKDPLIRGLRIADFLQRKDTERLSERKSGTHPFQASNTSMVASKSPTVPTGNLTLCYRKWSRCVR